MAATQTDETARRRNTAITLSGVRLRRQRENRWEHESSPDPKQKDSGHTARLRLDDQEATREQVRRNATWDEVWNQSRAGLASTVFAMTYSPPRSYGETVTLTLSNPSRARIADGSATGTIRSEELPALTAAFEDVPAEHDGSAFTFDVRFSDNIDVPAKVLRDYVFHVRGGRVTKSPRVDSRNDLRRIHVQPGNGQRGVHGRRPAAVEQRGGDDRRPGGPVDSRSERGRQRGDLRCHNGRKCLARDELREVRGGQHLNDHWDLDHPFERLLVDTAVRPDPAAVSWINPRLQPGEERRVMTGIPRQDGRGLHPRPRHRRVPVGDAHRGAERDQQHRRRDRRGLREPGDGLRRLRAGGPDLPHRDGRQGLGVRIRLTENLHEPRIHWNNIGLNGSTRVGKGLARPEMAGSPAGSPRVVDACFYPNRAGGSDL